MLYLTFVSLPVETIECVLRQRPDLNSFALSQLGSNPTAGQIAQKLDYWWNSMDGRQLSGNVTLEQWLEGMACKPPEAAPTPPTPPTPPATPGGGGDSGDLLADLLGNKWLLYGVGGFIALKFLRIIR